MIKVMSLDNKYKVNTIIKIFKTSTFTLIRLFITLPMYPGALSILNAKSPRSELIVN